MINDYKETLHYVPSKLFYKEVDLETQGLYTVNEDGGGTAESIQNLDALCESFIDMENLIKKNFKLSSEKLMKFTDNNPVQLTLREELEMVYKARNHLEAENQNLKLSLIANRENDSKNMLELHNNLEKAKNELIVQQLNIDGLNRTFRNMEAF